MIDPNSNINPNLAFIKAPEVGANLVIISEYNSECDMWSIGVLFYQCLIGSVSNDL